MSKKNTKENENEKVKLNMDEFNAMIKYQHTLFIFIPTGLLAYITYLFSTSETPTIGASTGLMLATMIMFGITSFYLKDYYWKLFVKNDKIASKYSKQVKEWISSYETEELNVIFNNLNDEKDKDNLKIYTLSVDNAKNAFSLMKFSANMMYPLAFLLILQFYNILLLTQ